MKNKYYYYFYKIFIVKLSLQSRDSKHQSENIENITSRHEKRYVTNILIERSRLFDYNFLNLHTQK